MKEKICYLIHTEYHLLLALYDILEKYNDANKFDVSLVLKRSHKSARLKQDLNLSILPYKIKILDFNINLKGKLSAEEKHDLDELLKEDYAVFIFFQEQDPITIIIINKYIEKKTKIYLYQDGLKPYVMNSMKFSLGLVLNDINQNSWIKRNGYPVKNNFSFLTCRKYGFLKGIDKLYLTFPQAYDNWNSKPIENINPEFTEQYKTLLKKVFLWDDSLLDQNEKVLFFMNQPLHDDGSFELNLLEKLQAMYPGSPLYIKNHPLTPKLKIDKYKQLKNVSIINSKIPAEIFVSELKNSIVFSVCSTSMFINNKETKFYWTNNIQEKNNIKRLKKYVIVNPTTHIKSVSTIKEIVF